MPSAVVDDGRRAPTRPPACVCVRGTGRRMPVGRDLAPAHRELAEDEQQAVGDRRQLRHGEAPGERLRAPGVAGADGLRDGGRAAALRARTRVEDRRSAGEWTCHVAGARPCGPSSSHGRGCRPRRAARPCGARRSRSRGSARRPARIRPIRSANGRSSGGLHRPVSSATAGTMSVRRAMARSSSGHARHQVGVGRRAIRDASVRTGHLPT